MSEKVKVKKFGVISTVIVIISTSILWAAMMFDWMRNIGYVNFYIHLNVVFLISTFVSSIAVYFTDEISVGGNLEDRILNKKIKFYIRAKYIGLYLVLFSILISTVTYFAFNYHDWAIILYLFSLITFWIGFFVAIYFTSLHIRLWVNHGPV